MAKSIVYRRGAEAEAVSINMTPMIDVTFQLIIFFILAGQLASQELAKVELHRPYDSQAIPEEKMPKDRVIVNVVSRAATVEKGEPVSPFLAAQAEEYRVGATPITVGDTRTLVEALKKRREQVEAMERDQDKKVFVEVRADFRVSYSQVEPVMLAAAAAGFEKMHLTALVKRPGE